MPDPKKILTTIRRATELMRATPGRSGGIIAPERAEEIMVVGDLHGNIPAFRKVLTLAALDRNPGRHLVLQELIHGKQEYGEDKGDRSHQLLDVVAALEVPVSRSGPPDPGQSRAFRADGPDHRQGRQDPEPDVPHGDLDGVWRVGRRDL